jgi:hypothetical protein
MRLLGFGCLASILCLTLIGLLLSFMEKGTTGSGRSFGVPEIMVIAIIAIPSIGIIFLNRWLEHRRKKMIIEATRRR